MAAFGTLAPTNPQQAIAAIGTKAIAAGYTPDNDLGDFGVLAAVLGSMLEDAIPAPVGTSAAPGVAFTGDSDLGFFRVGANEIGVTASGANVGGWTASGFKPGHTSSTAMSKFVVYSTSLVPVTVASAAIEETTFTVTGITTGDKVYVNPPAIGSAVSNAAAPMYWRVSATDVLVGAFVNISAVTSAKGPSGTYLIVAIRS